MNLQTMARQALANIQAAVPTSVVTVVYGSESGDGTVSSRSTVIDPGMGGDRGATSRRVWVSASAISEPVHGDRITIGGTVCYVVGTALDPVGGLRMIEYAESRPTTGLEGVQ
jgi:hypothetical protein